MAKQVVLITGSHHHPGTSEALADAFVTGVETAGTTSIGLMLALSPLIFCKLMPPSR